VLGLGVLISSEAGHIGRAKAGCPFTNHRRKNEI